MTLKEENAVLNWSQATAEIEANLESVRLREMKRYAWKMRGATEEQKALVSRLSRELLRHAVLDALQRAERAGAVTRPEELETIRRMFAEHASGPGSRPRQTVSRAKRQTHETGREVV